MTKKAKQYSAQEKAKVALEVIKGELTMSKISSQYGVHATQINRWRKEALEGMVSGFQSKPKATDTSQAELINQLYIQIGQLTVERDWLKKNLQPLDLAVNKGLIDMQNKHLSIKRQCELLDLNRSSYYAKPRRVSVEEQKLLNRMDEIFTEHPYYGTRRMMHVLKSEGYQIGRKRIRRYYQILCIEAIYPKMNLSKRNQAHKVYPYLLNGLAITAPNQVWSMDITYIRLKQGFVYLCAIIDWYSRYVLSWRVSITLQSDFCIEALQEALAKYGSPEIFNTDQEVQFTSGSFIEVLQINGIAISMDGKGRALDNVFIERFWRSIKQEKIYRLDLASVIEAKHAIKEYMQFYNYKRPHQSLGYKTPANVHFDGIQEEPVNMMDKSYDLPAYLHRYNHTQKRIY